MNLKKSDLRAFEGEGEMRVRWKGGCAGARPPPASTELLLQCQLDRRQAMREVQVRCCCREDPPNKLKQEESEQSDLALKVNQMVKVGVTAVCESFRWETFEVDLGVVIVIHATLRWARM